MSTNIEQFDNLALGKYDPLKCFVQAVLYQWSCNKKVDCKVQIKVTEGTFVKCNKVAQKVASLLLSKSDAKGPKAF